MDREPQALVSTSKFCSSGGGTLHFPGNTAATAVVVVFVSFLSKSYIIDNGIYKFCSQQY
jgi:hypothetical protein